MFFEYDENELDEYQKQYIERAKRKQRRLDILNNIAFILTIAAFIKAFIL